MGFLNTLTGHLVEDGVLIGATAAVLTYVLRKFLLTEVGKLVEKAAIRIIEILADREITEEEIREGL